jgi:NitT/TauT family transport system substrate-binding protein
VDHEQKVTENGVNTPREKPFELNIISGGPNAPVIQKVMTGQCDFGVANADDVILAQSQGMDVVAIFAAMDSNPRCLMLRKDSGITKVQDIQNMTLALSSRPSFSHWLRSQYSFQNVNFVPYPGSIAPFVQQKNFGQQAYSISEPFLARQKGVEPQIIMVSDLGYNPYCSVLIAKRNFIEQNPQRVQAMVKASQQGWLSYAKEPLKAHKKINKMNPEMGMDILAYGHAELPKLLNLNAETYGSMSLERWETLVSQMVDAELIEPGSVDPKKCFELRFL